MGWSEYKTVGVKELKIPDFHVGSGRTAALTVETEYYNKLAIGYGEGSCVLVIYGDSTQLYNETLTSLTNLEIDISNYSTVQIMLTNSNAYVSGELGNIVFSE